MPRPLQPKTALKTVDEHRHRVAGCPLRQLGPPDNFSVFQSPSKRRCQEQTVHTRKRPIPLPTHIIRKHFPCISVSMFARRRQAVRGSHALPEDYGNRCKSRTRVLKRPYTNGFCSWEYGCEDRRPIVRWQAAVSLPACICKAKRAGTWNATSLNCTPPTNIRQIRPYGLPATSWTSCERQ